MSAGASAAIAADATHSNSSVEISALTGVTCWIQRPRALTKVRNRTGGRPPIGTGSHSRYSFGIQELIEAGRAFGVAAGGLFHQGSVRLQA